jgi:hypothetical protein
MSIALKYPGTDAVKLVPEGWSWACFFGSGVLGIPLFKRGLIVWGSAMLVFDLATFIVGWTWTDAAVALHLWLSGIGVGASFFFGWKANDLAVQRAVAHGWEIADRRRQWFD